MVFPELVPPENPDRLDDYISKNFELKEQFEIGHVKGSVFKAPGLGFFMVFDDPENKVLEGIRGHPRGLLRQGALRDATLAGRTPGRP